VLAEQVVPCESNGVETGKRSGARERNEKVANWLILLAALERTEGFPCEPGLSFPL